MLLLFFAKYLLSLINCLSVLSQGDNLDKRNKTLLDYSFRV